MRKPRADGTRWGLEGLPDRLKLTRQEQKLTQSALAAKVKLTEAHISHFECGQRLPCLKNLRALALALRTSADWLLDL